MSRFYSLAKRLDRILQSSLFHRRRARSMNVAGLLTVLVMAAHDGDAQPPPKKGFGPNKGFARPVTVDQIVERIMSFDKNNDGKVVPDELPERMQHLIALGD